MPCQNVTFPGDLGKLKQLLHDLQAGVTVNDQRHTYRMFGRNNPINDWSSRLLFELCGELGLLDYRVQYRDQHTRTYFLTRAGRELFHQVMGEESRGYTAKEYTPSEEDGMLPEEEFF